MTQHKEIPIKDVDTFIKKINEMKKEDALDLSSDEDLSIAIMNLVSIEEHFFFTAAKTGNKKYYDLLAETRVMRATLLKRIIKDYEGEVWCISKHLLAASMRLMEVGTKQFSRGNKEDAYDFFEKAYQLYSLFWGLNLKLIDPGTITGLEKDAINKHDTEKKGLLGKLGDVVKKAIDCCIE